MIIQAAPLKNKEGGSRAVRGYKKATPQQPAKGA
jgi:hypothetical protein